MSIKFKYIYINFKSIPWRLSRYIVIIFLLTNPIFFEDILK